MGACESKNTGNKDNKINNEIYNKKEIQKEVEIPGHDIIKIDLELHEVCKSICKIIIQDDNETYISTGFLIKMYRKDKPFYFLMTNEHVIKNEFIYSKKTVEFFYDYEKQKKIIVLDRKDRLIQDFYFLDITIVEILEKDNINKGFFLLPCLDNYNNPNDLVNKNIYIPQFPKGGDLCNSKGEILEINKYELAYDAGTKSGSSGSPIFLQKSTKVIGIHKGGIKEEERNYGDLIYPVLDWLNEIFRYNKDQYEGEYVNGVFHGKGKYIYNTGKYYIGEWRNGKRNGKGKFYLRNNFLYYDGEWVNDNFEGFGKLNFEDGDYYIGELKNSLRWGKGTSFYKNGNTLYSGDWKNDKANGKGKFYYENGNLIYEGEFLDDKREGIGIYHWEDGSYSEGMWHKDKRNGIGKYYYPNGNLKYEGYFVEDKFEGEGKYIHEDGSYYIGEFKNDKKCGKGKEYDKDGKVIIEGNFIDGKCKKTFNLDNLESQLNLFQDLLNELVNE